MAEWFCMAGWWAELFDGSVFTDDGLMAKWFCMAEWRRLMVPAWGCQAWRCMAEHGGAWRCMAEHGGARWCRAVPGY